MTSLFYSRYVPPADSSVGASVPGEANQLRPAKKRKRTSSTRIEYDKIDNDTPEVPGQALPNIKISHSKTSVNEKGTLSSQTESTTNSIPANTLPGRGKKEVEDDNLLGNKKKKKTKKKKNEKKIHEEVEDEGQQPCTESRHEGDGLGSNEDSTYRLILADFNKSVEGSAKLVERGVVPQQDDLKEHDQQAANPVEFHGLVPLPQPLQVPDNAKSTLSELPGWLGQPIVVSASDTVPFNSLSMHPNLVASLGRKGYENTFAVQAAVLPMLLAGTRQYDGDICISATTGSGKTLAYALPMVESLRDKPVTRLRGLVVVPTRELVAQARETLEMCSGGSGLKISTAVGSKHIKGEQDILVQRWERYDPDAYQAQQDKEINDDQDLMSWDLDDRLGSENDVECSNNYVLDYMSKVDILICTPGRLVDHMQSTKGFNLNHVQWLVIDEADRLLDESFQQWVDIVLPALEYLPPLGQLEEQMSKAFQGLHRRDLRKIILSATMTRDTGKLNALKLRKPRLVVLETDKTSGGKGDSLAVRGPNVESNESFKLPTTLRETAVPVKNSEDKPLYLAELLQRENAFPTIRMEEQDQMDTQVPVSDEDDDNASANDDQSSSGSTSSSSSNAGSSTFAKSKPKPTPHLTTHGTLIFTNNNESALRLARLLALLHPSWSPHLSTLTKSTSTSSARKALSAFRSRKTSVLIASDRASRGLDIENLAHVINYDMPTSVTSYVHRVGRTARAGKEGLATTLVGWNEGRWFWNEIGRGGQIGRGLGKKVGRVEMKLEGVGEKEMKGYEQALRVLGEEARGDVK